MFFGHDSFEYLPIECGPQLYSFKYLNHVQELTSFAVVSCWQVECMMAILIYKNLMKGYFAHKSKVVVLSKQDPFPKLNGKPVNS